MLPTSAGNWRNLAAWLNPVGVPPDRPVACTEADWRALFRLATAHLVAPALYATLAGRGQLTEFPLDIRDALDGLYQLNDQRNRRLRAILHDTVRLLNQAGIEPLLLKGAIALLPDQYPHAFARMLGDLDLAVAPTELPAAVAALESAGFYPAPNLDPVRWSPADHHHAPPLFHPSGEGYVELHHDLFRAPRLKVALPLAQVRAHTQPLVWDGVRLTIPTLEHRLLHNALHHQVQDQAFFSDRRSLRQLLEFAQLRALPAAAALDWPATLQRLDAVGVGNAVRSYLLAGQGLFGQPLPDGVTPTRAAQRAEARFWFRLDHPRLGRLLELRWQIQCYARRLPNLPKRLLTPTWYPAKYQALRRRWRPEPPILDLDDDER